MPEAADIQAIVASLSSNPFATIVTDNRKPDNPIVAANDAFFDLTGYCAEEVIGRNCRFLAGIGSEPEAQAALRVAIAEGTPAVVELWNYRKDGSPFRNALMIAPILDNFGNAVFFVGSQLEVRNQSLQNIRPLQSRRRVLALTSKQRRVLLLMTQGHRDRHIGEQLGIGGSAVKRLRSRLLGKLGVSSPAEAIRIGIEAGLASLHKEIAAPPERRARSFRSSA